MEIKGNIGDEVYVKATIESIKITKLGITYQISINSIEHSMSEQDVMFIEKIEKPALKIQEPAPASKKKRGRPRKATVETLLEKSKAIKKGDGK